MPSRGRPVAQLQAIASILSTSSGGVDVLVIVDADDPAALVVNGAHVRTQVNFRRQPMLHLLNAAVMANLDNYAVFGFTGDDVRYETPGWDTCVWRELEHEVGVVYGDDCVQGQNLPTHPWFSAGLAKALGYAVPPCLEHYYFDTFLKSLTAPLGALHWQPELVTRHCHHSVGGMPHDATYRQNEFREGLDRVAFESYRTSGLFRDQDKLKAFRNTLHSQRP